MRAKAWMRWSAAIALVFLAGLLRSNLYNILYAPIPHDPYPDRNCNVDASSHSRVFDALGAIDATCRNLEKFGEGDDEKRVCMDDIDPSTPCLVVSLGSNNQWGFEEAVFARTHCEVHTFDCTGDFTVPAAIASRVTLHKQCVGPETVDLFTTWEDLVATHGSVAVLKMDIEGWEWPVLQQIAAAAAPPPTQMLVEIHACTYFERAALPQPPYVEVLGPMGKSPHGIDARFAKLIHPEESIAALMTVLRARGVALLDRHDNPFCPHCSEVNLHYPKGPLNFLREPGPS